MENLARLTAHIRTELAKVIVGQRETVDQLLIVLACGGHALLEGIPGLAKTLTIKTLSRICGLGFQRVHARRTDARRHHRNNVFNLATSQFTLHRGPIFTDLLLVDESTGRQREHRPPCSKRWKSGKRRLTGYATLSGRTSRSSPRKIRWNSREHILCPRRNWTGFY